MYYFQLFRDKNILDSVSKSQRMKEEDLAVMKVKVLAKQKSLQCKRDSLYRYQDLLKATIATSPDLASVKECYGKDWFKPDWNRYILLYSTYTCILAVTHIRTPCTHT